MILSTFLTDLKQIKVLPCYIWNILYFGTIDAEPFCGRKHYILWSEALHFVVGSIAFCGRKHCILWSEALHVGKYFSGNNFWKCLKFRYLLLLVLCFLMQSFCYYGRGNRSIKRDRVTHKEWDCKDDRKLLKYDNPKVRLSLPPYI